MEPKVISWNSMDFGTQKDPQCGICNDSVFSSEGTFDEKGNLIEDIICYTCSKIWVYDEEEDGYVKRVGKNELKYEIDCILDCKRYSRMGMQYLVKWIGLSEPVWESVDDLTKPNIITNIEDYEANR